MNFKWSAKMHSAMVWWANWLQFEHSVSVTHFHFHTHFTHTHISGFTILRMNPRVWIIKFSDDKIIPLIYINSETTKATKPKSPTPTTAPNANVWSEMPEEAGKSHLSIKWNLYPFRSILSLANNNNNNNKSVWINV